MGLSSSSQAVCGADSAGGGPVVSDVLQALPHPSCVSSSVVDVQFLSLSLSLYCLSAAVMAFLSLYSTLQRFTLSNFLGGAHQVQLRLGRNSRNGERDGEMQYN